MIIYYPVFPKTQSGRISKKIILTLVLSIVYAIFLAICLSIWPNIISYNFFLKIPLELMLIIIAYYLVKLVIAKLIENQLDYNIAIKFCDIENDALRLIDKYPELYSPVEIHKIKREIEENEEEEN